MIQTLKNTNSMDSRIKFKCPHCGVTNVIFTYMLRQCAMCRDIFPNILLMGKDVRYRKDFYFGKEAL